MRKAEHFILILLLLLSGMMFTGCWNYREIEKVGIVGGVAVDKGSEKKYKVTVEIVDISEDKQSKLISKLVSSEGDTIFDAVRDIISVSGKRLYWPHARAIIISREIAKRGVVKVADWYNRDSETREDTNVFLSGEATASEILEEGQANQSIKSFELGEMIENENSLGKAPHIEIWEFINDLEADGISAILPVVSLKSIGGRKALHIGGTALFRHDELAGFINEEDTKYLMFVRNKIKAGILTQVEPSPEGNSAISLEIFKNRTKIEPDIHNGKIEMNVNTDTTVAIDEIDGTGDYIQDEDKRSKLEEDAEKSLEAGIEGAIEKVQNEFGADVFGFGARLHEDMPGEWDKVSKNWEDEFENLKVNVHSMIHIRNSAMLSKAIEMGD